jgi:hypothetical protein
LKAIRVRWRHTQAYLGIVKWLGWQILAPLGLKR